MYTARQNRSRKRTEHTAISRDEAVVTQLSHHTNDNRYARLGPLCARVPAGKTLDSMPPGECQRHLPRAIHAPMLETVLYTLGCEQRARCLDHSKQQRGQATSDLPEPRPSRIGTPALHRQPPPV